MSSDLQGTARFQTRPWPFRRVRDVARVVCSLRDTSHMDRGPWGRSPHKQQPPPAQGGGRGWAPREGTSTHRGVEAAR